MPHPPWNVAAVSFLNARPLVHHLADRPDVRLLPDVPSRLAGLLQAGHADVALLPVVDYAILRDQVQIVSDACIGCDGQTLTVRVFCRREPPDVSVIHVDADSHTSVVLARLLWQERFGRRPRFEPLESLDQAKQVEAVLLIGDKVITQWRERWPCQVDLGEAWKELTGLPFVFAVWAARDGVPSDELAAVLQQARDAGCREARRLAQRYGPEHGWPVPLAEEYLTHYMKYRIDAVGRQAIERFLQMAQVSGLLNPSPARGLAGALEARHGR